MNISDAERVASVLDSLKYQQTSNINEADLVVVTMCSVRQSAVDRVHGLVEKFKKLIKSNPKLKTILTGCILQKDKKIFVEGFDYVIEIKEINRLPELLARQTIFSPHILASHNKLRKISLPRSYLNITPKYTSSFSANVPIMTGCNNFCAYCVVPYGKSHAPQKK